jgi:hypothetical protein
MTRSLPTSTRLFGLAAVVLLAGGSRLAACPGNEYWQNDPKDPPVWTSREELDVQQNESKVSDDLLRAAFAKSGLVPCPGTERDLITADVKMAVRTKASPISKEKGLNNYDEVTQIMIRYRKDPKNLQAAGVLEIMTRTKVRFSENGPFFRARPEFQANAIWLAKKVSDNLTVLLSK